MGGDFVYILHIKRDHIPPIRIFSGFFPESGKKCQEVEENGYMTYPKIGKKITRWEFRPDLREI